MCTDDYLKDCSIILFQPEFLSNFDLENAGTKLFDQVDRFLGVEGNRRQLAQFLSPVRGMPQQAFRS